MTRTGTGSARVIGWLGLGAIAGVALLESVLGIVGPHRAPKLADLRAAAQAVRAEISGRDVIAVAPTWIDPLVRSELGELMPIERLGRPDGRRYPHIFELGFRGARHADTRGLTPDFERSFGGFALRRYTQAAVEVSYDLVEHFLDAKVLQYPLNAPPPPSGPSGPAADLDGAMPLSAPCLFRGPQPTACPPPGPAGAYFCPLGRVERRTLEIAYQPRYGLSIVVGEGQVTELTWPSIPAAAWQGASLHLWLGLHDYHARKNAVGPAQVIVDLDGRQGVSSFVVTPAVGERELAHSVVALPPATGSTSNETTHRITLRISAASAAHHNVGVLAELRR